MSDYLDLGLAAPFLNVSGFLGFNPSRQVEQYGFLGGWITPPVGQRRRHLAVDRTVQQFPGGVLIHNGLPNPGVRRVLKENSSAWRRLSIPTWVHIIPESPEHMQEIVSRLEEVDSVAVIELGFIGDQTIHEIKSLCSAAVGKLPLVIDIPLNYMDLSVFEKMDLPNLLAVSLSAPRGSVFSPDQKIVTGRLYGPALFPQAVSALEKALSQSLPIIMSGGIDSLQKGKQLLEMGAAAIKIDLPLWKGVMPE